MHLRASTRPDSPSAPVVAAVVQTVALFSSLALAADCTDATTAPTGGLQPSAPDAARYPGLASLVVTPRADTLTAGNTAQLTATAYDSSGGVMSGVTFAWRSSDTSVARVDSTELVQAREAGTLTISASAARHTGSATVRVAVSTSPPPSTSSSGRQVPGYYVRYRRSLYPETAVDFTRVTHVITGAAEPTSTGEIDTTFLLDNVNGPAMARTLASRAHAAGLRASYANAQELGGVMLWTNNEQHLASAPGGSQDPLVAAAYSNASPQVDLTPLAARWARCVPLAPGPTCAARGVPRVLPGSLVRPSGRRAPGTSARSPGRGRR